MMADERLAFHLDNWAGYQHGGERLGAPGNSSGIVGCGNNDFESMVQAADRRCAEAVDALITGLALAQQNALFHRYLHAVLRFNRNDYPENLDLAREAVRVGLHMRGIW